MRVLIALTILLLWPLATNGVAPTVPSPTTAPAVNLNGYWDSIALIYMGVMPWGVTFVFYAWYVYSGDGIFSALSWYNTFVTLSIIPVQAYFNDLQPDPYYTVVTHWAFPNLESVVVGLLLVYTVFFRYWYKVKITWFQCLILALLFVMPPFVHIWRGRLVAWKALISIAWGIGMGCAFCPILWINQMGFAYLFSAPPVHSWYSESIALRDARSRATYKRLKQWNDGRDSALQQRTSSWGPFSILYSKYGSTRSQLTTLQTLSSGI